jgi:hypothetical protein
MKTYCMPVAAAFLLATATQSFAQIAETVPTSTKPDLGSVYVRCDGHPPHRTAADIAGRLLLIMGTAGLAGPGEGVNISKRLTGADAVAACDAALADETDPIRKVELILARAVHHIEAKDFEAALADARSAPALAGPQASDLGFQHSLAISAIELEAAALARLGRLQEAAAAGIRMEQAAPYDYISQARALRFVQLDPAMPPEKMAYLDRLGRIYPIELAFKAAAQEWAGKYLDAAQSYQDVLPVQDGFTNDKTVNTPQPSVRGARSLALALGGDMQRSNAEAAETRKLIEDMIQSGKAVNNPGGVESGSEYLDLQAVVAELAAGNAAHARAMFTARSRWVAAAAPVIADITARLRQGASPAELTGPLAKDPATIRSDGLSEMVGKFTNANTAAAQLYSAILPEMTASTYSDMDSDVWNTKESPFLLKKSGKENYNGDEIYVRGKVSVAQGDAVYMHAALLARSKGYAGFVLHPNRPRVNLAVMRFGNPGDPGMPANAFMDAATVIAALSEEFPDPSIKKDPKK